MASSAKRWRGRAFGLSIDGDVALPGLRPAGPGPADGERPLAIETASPAPLDERPLGERVCEWRDDSGQVTLAIDRGDAGYRFLVTGVGLYELSADGSVLRCTPVPAAGWPWRRYLIAQVLPFAAVLQGLEVFHASAVAIGGEAVAISGPSGLGKSTLALELQRTGAGFLTDDVLALEIRDGVVLAHSGTGLVKVRRRTGAGLVEVRRALATVPEPLPLGTFCLLEPSADDELHVREVPAEPRHLLGSTFNLVVATAERLSAQLDVCAGMSRQARVLRAAVPPRLTADTAGALHTTLAVAPAVA